MEQARQLIRIVNEYESVFKNLTEAEWSAKPDSRKWSKKEILGHLIDSALNNLRRFIVTQYRPNDNIVYEQDEWVKLQNYQQADVNELIQLWKGLNNQIARVIRLIPQEKLENTCDTGKDQAELHTLAFLIEDYITHLRHHLSQIEKK